MGTSGWVLSCVACALCLAGCDEAVEPAVAPPPRAEAAPAALAPPPPPPPPVLGGGMPPPGATGTIGLGTIGTIGRGSAGSGSSSGAGASVRTGEATVAGGRYSREIVRRVVRRHIAEARHCYDAQLIHAPDLAGRVTLRWVIGPDGAVSHAEVESSTLASATAGHGDTSARAVESCLVERVAAWTFPAPEGGVVTVDYPFVLDPAPPSDSTTAPAPAERAVHEPGLGLRGS